MPRTFGLYEHRSLPLLPGRLFYRRLMWHALVTGVVILASLAVGILGYHLTGSMPWLDALLNASMILGGMGPVDQLHTDAGKWLASAYALYSGLLVLVAAGILMAPIADRIMHRMHLRTNDDDALAAKGRKPPSRSK